MEKPPYDVMDAYVDLTGTATRGVRFSGCVLNADESDAKTTVIDCVMDDCLFVGEGWPKPLFEVVLRHQGRR